MANNNPTNQHRDVLEPPACACANLRKAARAVTQVYDEALRPSGLKATQFTVLATLAKRGELPLTKLAEVLVMDRTTLTRNLKPLVAKGWVGTAEAEDQRVRRIALTDAGREVLGAALPLWRGAQAQLAEGLGPERLTELLDDLARTVAVTQGR